MSSLSGLTQYPAGVYAIDTLLPEAGVVASHLIVHGGRAAFVDCGTALAVPLLLEALDALKVKREEVDWLFLTHIHLDHAGGAGTLMEQLPNARLVVHPRGAAHLVEPTKLIASTIQVHGEATYRRLFGEIKPVAQQRIVVSSDGLQLSLAGRPFHFLHTPGHAPHHHVIHDSEADSVFTGDAFGMSYRNLDAGTRTFIMPATPPTQFDPEQMRASISRIVGLKPAAAYLTHYGRVTGVEQLASNLFAAIDTYVGIAERCRDDPQQERRMRQEMFDWCVTVLDRNGERGDLASRHHMLDGDIAVNVQGLMHWLVRRG